ncbi:MAG TPA: phospholipase A, partial [Pseudomonas sp.]|nr:phospholipase A [Pseudomonas sp.]
ATTLLFSGVGIQELQANVADEQTRANAKSSEQSAWQDCQHLAGRDARLACYDGWAQRQSAGAIVQPERPAVVSNTAGGGCRDRQYSALSRFWELEAGSDCGTFGLRGYRPLNLSIAVATHRPETPASEADDNSAYQANEARIGLSLRTKLAQNLLTDEGALEQDSLWFGYSQQSTWQVFNEDMSRPFRSTDHEPEIMYVHPTDLNLFGGWRLRYTGAGVVHHSNGESRELSRSWNRVYLMGGAEFHDRFQVTGRLWQRIREDAETDDNPDIADYIGRAEITGRWNYDPDNTFDATLRSSLKRAGRGSIRLEWFKAIGDPTRSNLRFHAQLFHGYGDTLIDYDRARTVLSIGLSLVDF